MHVQNVLIDSRPKKNFTRSLLKTNRNKKQQQQKQTKQKRRIKSEIMREKKKGNETLHVCTKSMEKKHCMYVLNQEKRNTACMY